MGTIATTANSVFRDYSTDGVPSSGPQNPVKTDIRNLFGVVDAAVRQCATAGITVQVGFPGAVDSATSINCATVQQALLNICANYDHKGYPPTIQCAGPTTAGGGGSIQTYTGGFVVSYGDLNTYLQPTLIGANQIILDLGGSILDSTVGYTVCVRGTPMCVTIQNGTFQNSGSSNVLYAYGGGSHIELGPNVVAGNNASNVSWGQASRGGAIRCRPGSARFVINKGTVGGQSLFEAIIMGGSIELEGMEFHNANSGTTFSIGVFSVSDNSFISFAGGGVAFTGYNFVGPQAQVANGGVLRTNDNQGGQTMTIPADAAYGTSATTVVTNNNTAVAGSSYLPGTTPILVVGAGDIDYWPDLPAPTGAGTGYVVQGAEPGIVLGVGSGATSPITLHMATVTNWRCAQISSNNAGALPNLSVAFAGPSGTTPGTVYISWTGTYSGAALGVYVFISMMPGIPM